MTFTARVEAVEPGKTRKYAARFTISRDGKVLEPFELERDNWVQLRADVQARLAELRLRYELADAARLWVGQVITET